MADVLVVQHEDACPVDRFGPWCEAAGLRLTLCRPYAGDALPERVEQDGLLVLGGSMGALDDAAHPWLEPVRRLLATAAGSAVPTLGICLGAQLLAAGCGGRVGTGADGIEAGVVDVRWRSEAASDRLVAGLPDPYAAPSMHRDAVVELPPDATWLGSTARYPHQAFRVGAAAWGVQFHPEVSLATYTAWAASHGADGVDPAAVVAQLSRRQEAVTAGGRALATRFADQVHARAAVRAA